MSNKIIALAIRQSDPALISNFTTYLQSSGKMGGGRDQRANQQAGDAIEQNLAKVFDAKVSPEAFAVADLQLFPIGAERLARALGIDVGSASSIEIKSKFPGATAATKIGTLQPFGSEGTGILPAIKAEVLSSESGAVDINDRGAFIKALRKKLGGASKILGFIKQNDPDLHLQWYQKTKNLAINKAVINPKTKAVTAVDTLLINFPYSQFKNPPFEVEVRSSGELELILNKAFEKQLLNELEKTGPAILAKNTDEFIKGLEAIPGKKRLSGERLMKGVSVGYDVVMSVPTGGSIPRLRTKTTPAKGGKAQKAQKFISSAQLSALTQKRMGQIMPKGPKKGPPLSPNVLTERSGRFRKSVRVIPNYRSNLLKYLYDPIYKTFVDTDRNPDELIEKSIRETVQGLFARQFRVVRGF